jgi:glycogen(starch) synthase
MTAYPPVSVIINTDGRAAILGNTIENLRYLRYPELEVVVVPGPTPDGTREMLRDWQGEVKVGYCPARNIAQSRNIGIGVASGEFIAFLDDDEVPEPEWLEQLVPMLEDPAVAIAGGWLHDHTGVGYEARFETVDRFGERLWQRRSPEFNFPLSFTVPFLDINSVFRRSALIDICGFDEEFEYLFDDTDIVCRFVDSGWHVAQTDRTAVHHRYLHSSVRNEQRVFTSWYSFIKNKTYFALLHAQRFVPIDRILKEVVRFIEANRADVRLWIARGVLPADALPRFEQEADRAVRDGAARALRGRRLADPGRLAGDPGGFVRFRTHLPAERQHCFVLLDADDPPDRRIRDLARRAAAEGHQVHLLMRGEGHDRVEFEDGIWMHRIVPRQFPAPAASSMPADLWNRSMTMLAEAEEIARRRAIAAVYAPLSSGAAIAFLQDHKWPLATVIGTVVGADGDGTGIIAAGRELLAGSDALIAAGEASVAACEAAYGLRLERNRLLVLRDGGDGHAEVPGASELEFLLGIGRRG